MEDSTTRQYKVSIFPYPEQTAVWLKFRGILWDIHKEYGLPPDAEGVRPAEVLYAASIFFTLEKEELDGLLKTEERRKEYGLLKASVQGILNLCAEPDTFVFEEMRQFFACDFAYLNQIISNLDTEADELPIPDDDVMDGLVLGYNAILLLVKVAGFRFYFSDQEKSRMSSLGFRRSEISSIMEYYRQKELQKAKAKPSKKEITAAITLRKSLRERLKARVKGQDLAVEKFVDGYIRYRVRGKSKGKPAGIYLFAGPPGTGKTYLAEVFAELAADEGYAYRRFEMAAYGGESGDMATGLVGFERTWRTAQPGQLTDFVKKNPKCVLLFDEIEKAGAQVRLLFLSVLEGASLTDRYYDEQVSFEDAILIFTTNEGRDLYEDNRGTNLTALSDSAVADGLRESKFVPELLSRFLSGTIVMFNHLDYFHMAEIFEASVREAVGQLCKDGLELELHYGDELPRLYLLSKGDNIDARFVSANAGKTAEDIFLEAMEFLEEHHPGSLEELREAWVSVEVNDDVREYFETPRPRILGYMEGRAEVYTENTCRYDEKLSLTADCDWAESGESFKESLQSCNWNSSEDRYDAVLIDFTAQEGRSQTGAGYACLKAAAEENADIPIIAVYGSAEEKASLTELGATDFVRGTLYGSPFTPATEAICETERARLGLDSGELWTILGRRHFLKMAKALAGKNQRISADTAFGYETGSGKLKVRFTNLRLKAAAEENVAARRQDGKYLLKDRPKVRLREIFGSELAKKAVKLCIDNIRHPDKYRAAGVKLTRGILMYGAPGMGKTMFAKAMAYESKAEFISAVGSDFLGGNGIAKMEEMFQTARRKRPCILFIDEFDAISRSRRRWITSEQESVLEKFLKEMDGLETDNDRVYVVGATNYSLEELDSAVTRRFSSRIYFPYPNMKEREDFLYDVLERKNLKDRISERAVKTLNRMMYRKMRSYAEIEAFIEESIAEAVCNDVDVTERFLFRRVHDHRDGAARREKSQERWMAAAFHEAGHAVLQNCFGLENHYVTIVSRGNYGGYAMAEPRYDTGQDFLDEICICLGGRAAEMKALELSPETEGSAGINIGAESDLQRATQDAYDYVCRYGLGGRFLVVPGTFASHEGGCPEAVLPESEKEAIWASVKQILEQQRKRAEGLLQEHWLEVLALAFSLIYMQELDGGTVEEIIRDKIPHVEDSCFWDSDDDYKRMPQNDDEERIPVGYPVYPYSVIKLQPEETNAAVAEGSRYYYAVKKEKESLGIYENLQEAFARAFGNNASCRRFMRKEAAQEYLDMLEFKVFRQGEKRFYGFSKDGLAEMDESSAPVKYLLILKEEKTGMFREKAAQAGKALAQYLVEDVAEEYLDREEDFYLVIQIYDKALRKELICYMETARI